MCIIRRKTGNVYTIRTKTDTNGTENNVKRREEKVSRKQSRSMMCATTIFNKVIGGVTGSTRVAITKQLQKLQLKNSMDWKMAQRARLLSLSICQSFSVL